MSEIFERFKSETATHQMTVLHDDGPYRHLRFSSPESRFYWFDLITWPGNLAIKGGMGVFMFARDPDMFEFFRAKAGWNMGRINPDYWAEKLPGGRDSAREYDERVLRAELAGPLADHEKEYANLLARHRERRAQYDALPYNERWPYVIRGMREPVEPKTADEVRELIADYDDSGQLSHEVGARELLAELEQAGVVSDTWEWSLREYTVHYLWCCHAIQWGIAQYDEARQVAAAEVAR
jgi:hypothetical protein